MRARTLLPAVLLGFGLFSLALLPAPAADEKDEKEEKADAKALAAKEVQLVLKDASVAKAVEELAKKSGYAVRLHDPDGKTKDKKVTLDTGKTTFWDALNQLCEKAELVDDDPNRLAAPRPGPGGGIQPLPPVKGGPPQPPKVQPPPAKDDKEKDDGDEPSDEVTTDAPPAKPIEKAQGGGGAPPAPQGGGLGGAPLPGPQGGPAIARPIAWVPVKPGEIVLIPGKIKKADTKTAIRVRPTDRTAVAVDKDHFALFLELTVEPRLRWHELGAVKIDKALDNNDQKLESVKFEPVLPKGGPPRPLPPAGPGGGLRGGGFGGGGMAVARPAIGFGWNSANGLSRVAPLQFAKGKKETKSLKELTGTAEVSLLGDAEAIMVVDNLMKQAGKSVEGKKGGKITINKVTKEKDGTIVVEFTMELPDRKKVQPEWQVNIPIPADVQPAPMPVPLPRNGGGAPPAPPPVKPKDVPPAPPAKSDNLIDADAKPLPAPAVKAVPAQGQPALAPAAMPTVQTYAVNGLTLQDAKGNTIYGQIAIDWAKMKQARQNQKMEYVARYKAGKGMPAEPSKLVFTGRPVIEAKVAFTLKDVEVK